MDAKPSETPVAVLRHVIKVSLNELDEAQISSARRALNRAHGFENGLVPLSAEVSPALNDAHARLNRSVRTMVIILVYADGRKEIVMGNEVAE